MIFYYTSSTKDIFVSSHQVDNCSNYHIHQNKSYDYYKTDKIRITLDKNIKFKKFDPLINNTYFKNSKDLVIPEIKYSSKSHLGQFMIDLPFEKTRFSKYCIGLENLDLI